jgi:hypothetical protein
MFEVAIPWGELKEFLDLKGPAGQFPQQKP